jgi:cyclic pyranopterin phosphate synthase
MEGIKAAHLAGLGPIKINCVYLPGINDNEMDDFFDLALKKPLNVRIIEHMPVLIKDINGSAPEIEDKLTRFFKKSFSQFTGRLSDYLINKDHLAGSGPALSYSFPGMAGSIGIIRSSSKEICSTCNRLRLHANGDLAYCLFAHEFLNIKSLFEKNESFDKIDALIREYVIKKPFCHDGRYTRDRPMSSIGG